MEKEFVPYKLALQLKELGFDEPCIYYYKRNKQNIFELYQNDLGEWYRNSDVGEALLLWGEKYDTKQCSSPLYSQVFKWFRDKKLSDSCVCRYQGRDDGGIYYYYVITKDFGVEETRHFKEGFFTYEEAELECLEKLIEIVETKSE